MVMWVNKAVHFNLGSFFTKLALGGSEFDVSILLLKFLVIDPSLWLFLRSCFLVDFFLMKSRHLKGHISSFLSFYIKKFITSLLSRPHQIGFYFRYIYDKFLDLWNDLYWYFLNVCLFINCCWLGPLLWWKTLPKFLLTIGSIMLLKLVVVMSTSSVYRVSNNPSIVNLKILFSWFFFGLRLIFLYSSSNEVM